MVPDVSKKVNGAFVFRVKQCKNCFTLKGEGTAFRSNIGNCSTSNTEPHPRRLELFFHF
jgi:hypothetical protein